MLRKTTLKRTRRAERIQNDFPSIACKKKLQQQESVAKSRL